MDVEELFNAAQLLAGRHQIEAAPFIGSWQAMIDEFDKVTPSRVKPDKLINLIYEAVTGEVLKAFPTNPPPFKADKIDSVLQDQLKVLFEAVKSSSRSMPSFSNKKISEPISNYVSEYIKKWFDEIKKHKPRTGFQMDHELTKIVTQVQAKPGEGRIFQQTAEEMIRTLAKIVWISDKDKVQYLSPILNLLEQQQRLVIATLNYDNSIELLAENNGKECNTSIDKWSNTGGFDISEPGLHLLKLHGSIDWQLDIGYSLDQMPHQTITQIPADKVQESNYKPAVIFGQRNKLTAEGPFLDLLRAFKEELEKTDVLTIIGYSFRDPHVNVFISQWLNQKSTNRLRVFSKNFHASDVDFVQNLMRYCQSRIDIVPLRAGEGLKEIYQSVYQDKS